MGVVVGDVRAVGAGLDLADIHVAIRCAVGLLVWLTLFAVLHVNGHGLHISECLLRLLRRSLIVEVLLALMQSPLQLHGEHSEVVVALQAIAIRENVDGELGC